MVRALGYEKYTTTTTATATAIAKATATATATVTVTASATATASAIATATATATAIARATAIATTTATTTATAITAQVLYVKTNRPRYLPSRLLNLSFSFALSLTFGTFLTQNGTSVSTAQKTQWPRISLLKNE